MVKVIETNLSLKQGCDVKDHQSRVIEVESWDTYLEEIKVGECVTRMSCLGDMYGCSIPKKCRVFNFVYDDTHASCEVILWDGTITKKLMYRILE